MTLSRWLKDTAQRYRSQPLTLATLKSAYKLRMGAQRRVASWVGTPVWDREWDVLVILDACRPDQMAAVLDEYGQLPDEAATHWSRGSCSFDWIDRTFNDHPQAAARAGYVTANAFTNHDTPTQPSADLTEDDLAFLKRLYKSHWQDVTPDGDAQQTHADTGRAKVGSAIATVPPEPVTDHAIAAWRDRDQHDMDRLVIHYMQPHEPYRAHPEWGSGDSKALENLVDEKPETAESLWPQALNGTISHKALWQAGVANLRWVLDDVTERLLPNCEATVAISADHGNAMGEWGEWHHPPGALGPQVRRVPWLTVEATDSRSIEPDTDGAETVNASTDTQLKALGYR